MKTDKRELVGKHAFEVAGLGKAPFKFIGVNENRLKSGQPGGTCGYCWNGILYEYRIVSYDGKVSSVGCNCIEKVGDKGLIKAYKQSPEYRKMVRDSTKRRGQRAKEEIESLLGGAGVKEMLVSFPHPYGIERDGAKLTMMDYVNFSLHSCGPSGMCKLKSFVKRFIVKHSQTA